jgi:hypothetical protein
LEEYLLSIPRILYLQSLVALGVDTSIHDIRFVEDNWESPTLGAWGLGWEVWLNGMEVTQFTYFQQAGGLECYPVAGEITYGIERIAKFRQHLPVIAKRRNAGEALQRFVKPGGIHITKTNELRAGMRADFGQVGKTLTFAANDGDLDFCVCGRHGTIAAPDGVTGTGVWSINDGTGNFKGSDLANGRAGS